ncbi:MAG: hypothetical protein RR677_13665 [Acinetobacter sp.]
MIIGKQLFLSCLHGSERCFSLGRWDQLFLSCLHGSELMNFYYFCDFFMAVN